MSPEKVEEVRRDGSTKVYPGYLAQISLYGRALSEMREVDHRERGVFGLRLDFRPFQPLAPPPTGLPRSKRRSWAILWPSGA